MGYSPRGRTESDMTERLQLGGVKKSGVVSGSAYMCMFSSAQPVCLLVGAFNQFALKVIIDTYDPITTFLIVWGLFSIGRYFLSLVSCLEKFL